MTNVYSLSKLVEEGAKKGAEFERYWYALKQLVIEGVINSNKIVDMPPGGVIRVDPDPLIICVITIFSTWDVAKKNQYVDILPYGITRRLCAYSHRKKDDFIQLVKRALDERPHFICVNELGYPHPSFFIRSKSIKNRSEYQDTEATLKQEMQELVDKHGDNVYLIAGTYHDPTVNYNFGLIYHNDPIWQGFSETKSPIYHAKRTSAVKVKEKISTPATNNVRRYVSRYSYFKILICLDIYNPLVTIPLLANAARRPSKEDNRYSVIFVPSFWKKAEALNMACYNLSLLTGNIVIYTNGCDLYYNTGIFVAGEKVDKQNKKSGVECKVKNDHLLVVKIRKEYYVNEHNRAVAERPRDLHDFFVRTSAKLLLPV